MDVVDVVEEEEDEVDLVVLFLCLLLEDACCLARAALTAFVLTASELF